MSNLLTWTTLIKWVIQVNQISAGMIGGYKSENEMIEYYRNLGKRSADLTCGAPVIDHNGMLFADLPDRVVLDRSWGRTVSMEMNPFDFEHYRIVNGQEARMHSWPWQIRAIPCSKWRCTYLCGGSILSEYWTITAAHCIPYAADQGFVTAGAHKLWGDPSDINMAGKNYTVKEIINHPDWNRYKRNNDVALMRTKERIAFSDYVQPICIPEQDICFNEGTTCVVSGWGYTEETGPISDTLQEVAVKIIDFETCSHATMYNTMVYEDTQICAGYIDGQKDSCAGDSGGPLACRLGDNQPWVLYGVVSWGWGCARARKPGVYAKTSAYYDWIREKTDAVSAAWRPESASGKKFNCATCGDHVAEGCGEMISETPAITTTSTTTTTAISTSESTTTTTTQTTPTEPPITTPKLTTTTTTTAENQSITDSNWSPCSETYDPNSQTGSMSSPNFPKYYQANTLCEKLLWDNSDQNKYMLISVINNWLDNRKWCVRSGDKLEIQCDNVYYNFCHMMQAKSSFGQLTCHNVVKVAFKTNDVRQNKGFHLKYAIKDLNEEENTTNHCGLPEKIYYDGDKTNQYYNYGIVNVYRSLLYNARNNICDWEITVPEGNRAIVFFSTSKNWLTAYERYNKKTKEWTLKCRDAVIATDGEGNNSEQFCGRRYFARNNKYISETNEIKLKLKLDGSTHRRERFFFWVGMMDSSGTIRQV